MHLSTASRWAVRGAFVFGMLLMQRGAVRAKGEVVDTTERSCAVSGRVRLTVTSLDGRTSIVAGGDSQVRVKAVKEVRGAYGTEEARQYASRVQIRIDQRGDRVEVEAKYPRSRRKAEDLPRVLVHFEIVTPKMSDVSAKVGSGLLRVDGIDGRIELSAGEADLTARACSGQITADTKEGDLSLEDVRGDVAAHTSAGALKVTGLLEVLESEAADGRVEIRVLPGSVMKSEWRIRSAKGNLHLFLPGDFAAEIDVTTREGTIVTDHSIAVEDNLSRKRLKGRMNGGTMPLRIQTSEGDIHILR